MAQIVVITDSKDSDGAVVYRERVSRADLESEHFSGQLVERIGWALGDASTLEADGWMPLLRPPLKGASPGRSKEQAVLSARHR